MLKILWIHSCGGNTQQDVINRCEWQKWRATPEYYVNKAWACAPKVRRESVLKWPLEQRYYMNQNVAFKMDHCICRKMGVAKCEYLDG